MYKQINIKLDEALYNQIDKLAKETGADRTAIVRHILKQYFLRRNRAASSKRKQQA